MSATIVTASGRIRSKRRPKSADANAIAFLTIAGLCDGITDTVRRRGADAIASACKDHAMRQLELTAIGHALGRLAAVNEALRKREFKG